MSSLNFMLSWDENEKKNIFEVWFRHSIRAGNLYKKGKGVWPGNVTIQTKDQPMVQRVRDTEHRLSHDSKNKIKVE